MVRNSIVHQQDQLFCLFQDKDVILKKDKDGLCCRSYPYSSRSYPQEGFYMIKINPDIKCLIGCGCCCLDCPELNKDGCKLERKDRPFECNAYLCGDGSLKYYEMNEKGFEQRKENSINSGWCI